jgi:hypothetical protein
MTKPETIILDASLRSRLQQKKSTTKCPPRDFRRRLRRDTARTSSLPQIGLACASRTGAKWRQNRRCRKRKKRTPLGEVIGRMEVKPEHSEDDVIDNDLILIWGTQKRIITGADLLGRLLRGISTREVKPI